MSHHDQVSTIDQAVFGYSNGHRMLMSTLDLSAIDSYELAALSDLAPGSDATAGESYLTGSQLPSGTYALIRTWLAPEMPRPGCVWSHVLLIPVQALSTLVDLSVLLPLFRRPDRYATDPGFSEKLAIPSRAVGVPAPGPFAVECALGAVYQSLPVMSREFETGEWERALLGVWSQQWPRLRRRFVFRSLASSHLLSGQKVRYLDKWSTPRSRPRSAWIGPAVGDIVSREVTPLQRFLWRYGKDIEAVDDAFADLVMFHVDETSQGPDFIAERVFRRFGKGQASTLKNDLMGGGGKLALVRAASPAMLASLNEVI